MELNVNRSSLCRDQINIADLAQQCSSIVEPTGLARTLSTLGEFFDFDYMVIGVLDLSSDRPALRDIYNHSFPKDWVNLYTEESLHSRDPVVSSAAKSRVPFLWSSTSDKRDPILDAARDYGLIDGIAFASSPNAFGRQKALLSFAGSHKVMLSVLEKSAAALILITPLLHEAYSRTVCRKHQQIPESTVLTRRERQVVEWTMAGKSVEEIGLILSLSDDTIKFHLKNIYRKLNVVNRYQAVSVALRAGLL